MKGEEEGRAGRQSEAMAIMIQFYKFEVDQEVFYVMVHQLRKVFIFSWVPDGCWSSGVRYSVSKQGPDRIDRQSPTQEAPR